MNPFSIHRLPLKELYAKIFTDLHPIQYSGTTSKDMFGKYTEDEVLETFQYHSGLDLDVYDSLDHYYRDPSISLIVWRPLSSPLPFLAL